MVLGESVLSGGRQIRLCISGHLSRLRLHHLKELIRMAERVNLPIILDLQKVTAMDTASVRYLLEGEGERFELVCPRFVRQWMQQEAAVRKIAKTA